VVDDREHDQEHKVVAVDRRGTTVSVLFWDGMRELHHQDACAHVRCNDTSDQRAR